MKMEDILKYVEFAKNHSVKEVMREFGIAKPTVYLRNRKLGIKSVRSYTVSKPEKLRLLPSDYAENHTANDIADYCNVNIATVYLWKKKWGLVTKDSKKKIATNERNVMIKELSNKFTYESIGSAFNISRQRVEQIVNKR